MIDDYKRRWEPLFGARPWWSGNLLAYQLLDDGYDAEALAQEGMDEQLYAQAKALWLPTTQRCPDCKLVVDQPHTIYQRGGQCEECEWDDLIGWAKAGIARDEENAAHEAWLASLSPLERAYARAQMAQSALVYVGGIMSRDVQ